MQKKYDYMRRLIATGCNNYLGLNAIFYNNCRNLHALIGSFLSSICRQTDEFEIHVMRERVRAGNAAICCRKKKLISFATLFVNINIGCS